ncbi:hypothetical protein ACFL9T_04555 [Thermodesulfobacteriota bacterium]
MKSSRLLIEHQCPQCGAPATLEETDRLFACAYCRVKSYLTSSDYFRYLLPHSAPKDKELLFFPYWRFKGMHFLCASSGIEHRIVDESQRALGSRQFPVSVGIRSQVMKLRFVSPETEGRFLDPERAPKDEFDSFDQRFARSLPKPIFYQCFIGETLSLIYAPFYIDREIYDAVLNEPVTNNLPEENDISSFSGGRPDWRVRFIPAQCPDCGWDLEGDKDSFVLNCPNCPALWYPGKKKFRKMIFSTMPQKADQTTFLPFYRIKARMKGLALDSYADLVKLANLPKVIQPQWKERPFYFWAPAFKVRPKDFISFGRNATLSQPQQELIPEMPEKMPYPVTLPISEAVESLKLSLASFVKPPDTFFPKLSEIEIKAEKLLLVYIPFLERGNEISNADLRLRLNKKLLIYGRQL